MAINGVVTHFYLAWTTYPESVEPPNWSVVGGEDVPNIVTFDEDGTRRITQLWIAVVDDVGYLRSSDTYWYANLQRDPTLVLRIGGTAHKCAVSFVDDQAHVERVHEAFRAKYPTRSKMFRSIGIRTNNIIRLDCSRRKPDFESRSHLSISPSSNESAAVVNAEGRSSI